MIQNSNSIDSIKYNNNPLKTNPMNQKLKFIKKNNKTKLTLHHQGVSLPRKFIIS